jgi:hypothetical protein
METHPMPIPSARAANHRVWTAATAEYSLISGIVWRPRPWPRAVSRSAKTARWQGASSSPASFSRAYCAARSGSCPASASALQVSKFRRTAARRDGSSTRTNRQGWLNPTDGARQTSSSNFSTEPCGSGSGQTGAHHAARLATRAAGRGKRHRMQARTASRSRFNSYHNTAPDDQLHTGLGSAAERHRGAGFGFHDQRRSIPLTRGWAGPLCPPARTHVHRGKPQSGSLGNPFFYYPAEHNPRVLEIHFGRRPVFIPVTMCLVRREDAEHPVSLLF